MRAEASAMIGQVVTPASGEQRLPTAPSTLAARRRVLGDDHPSTLQSMNNFAAVCRELDEL
jgi:hypothetical protein